MFDSGLYSFLLAPSRATNLPGRLLFTSGCCRRGIVGTLKRFLAHFPPCFSVIDFQPHVGRARARQRRASHARSSHHTAHTSLLRGSAALGLYSSLITVFRARLQGVLIRSRGLSDLQLSTKDACVAALTPVMYTETHERVILSAAA